MDLTGGSGNLLGLRADGMSLSLSSYGRKKERTQ